MSGYSSFPPLTDCTVCYSFFCLLTDTKVLGFSLETLGLAPSLTAVLHFDASRREKKGLESSRDRNEGAYQRGEGGEDPS